jgi:putative hemolysin
MWGDATLLFALFLVNGLFAMSEIAVLSARRARLLQLADAGQAGAARALALSEEPTRFLSTVQVGITGIGILSGAVGEYAIADRLTASLAQVPALAPYAPTLSLVAMVLVLTYVSLIVGELVPKRLGLTHPERIATLVARPMNVLASAGRPLVYLLSRSTDAVLAILRVSMKKAPAVSPEEITVLMEQGTREGVFHRAERDIVANVLHLDGRQVGAVLTPRSDIAYLDLTRSAAANHAVFTSTSHGILPLCRGGLDHVVGFVRSTDVLGAVLRGEGTELERLASPPLFVPRTISLMALLQQFKQTHLQIALVVDEFGSIAGLVSLTDVTTAIVGELPETPETDPDIVVRADGTLLVDGGVEIAELERRLAATLCDEEADRHYHTLGGLTMDVLGRIPKVGDTFEREGHHFEVVDMDGHRVDRLLVSPTRTVH